jgi:hypothetical protein
LIRTVLQEVQQVRPTEPLLLEQQVLRQVQERALVLVQELVLEQQPLL